MQYLTSELDNGLKIIHLPTLSSVFYCGFAVNAGTRDEAENREGLAHFVEHTLFKGTKKRKAWHILNRMENVGGELNAYTSKEETFIYSIALCENAERAMELLSDLVFNSQFPENELDKEREVVADEINSYLDTPSELIFDEFEDVLFAGNGLGHSILGTPKSLETFNSAVCRSFVDNYYYPENMIFFSLGNVPFEKIERMAKRYMSGIGKPGKPVVRRKPAIAKASRTIVTKNLHQTHVIIGCEACSAFDEKRTALALLTNILGGPGMNSRLNVRLREKNGLVYNVESGLTTFTDTGVFSIYFGCDEESKNRCISLTNKELKRIRDNRLTTMQFNAAIKQWKGQLGVSNDNNENLALRLGKSFLRFGKYESLPEVYRKIDALTADILLETANEFFDENRLFMLVYQ
ncbi:MAG: insulinase family protein [Dysgonamonadaceae bacterium]|jgi:predicted Zn-dependent peptidase|nr:insulinase family protein [Dysgonamonadaceae bacterium]